MTPNRVLLATAGLLLALGCSSHPEEAAPASSSDVVSRRDALTNVPVTFKFDDFSNPSLLQINGSAIVSGTGLRLTDAVGNQAGSVFNKQKVSLVNDRSFSTYFRMRMTNSSSPPADGIVFVLQPMSNTAGGLGQGIGYDGIANSLGIEFDTYSNPNLGDPTAQHIGTHINGDMTKHLALVNSPYPNLASGATYHVWIDYDGLGNKLEVRIAENSNVRPASPVLSQVVELSGIFGVDEVYAGFTSATGGSWSRHWIDGWYFQNDYAPIDVVNNTYAKVPTAVSVAASPVSASRQSTITATVKNDDGTPRAGWDLELSTTQGTLSVTQATTDANGQVQAILTYSGNAPATARVSGTASGGAFGFSDVFFNGANQTVTASSGEGGAISPSGELVLPYGGSQLFTFAPEVGHHVAQVLLDGVPVGAGSSYLLSNVTAPHAVQVTYALDEFAVSASAGSNGAVSPEGTQLVTYGGSATFTFVPDSGYEVAEVFVDEQPVGPRSSFTFSDVIGPHSLSVTFVLIDVVPPETAFTLVPPANDASTTATFGFTSNEQGVSYACQLDQSGEFVPCDATVTLTALANGAHTLDVRATDAKGNTDPTPARYVWNVDTLAPSTSLVTIPANPSASTEARFDLGSNESIVTWLCQLDQGAPVSCDSPATFTGLAQGTHTFTARAKDAAGNVDPSGASYSWTVDTIAPSAWVASGPLSRLTVTSATFDFDANEQAVRYECRLDAEAFHACDDPVTFTGLSQGGHTLQVRASDTANNVGSESAPYPWSIDSLAPDTSLASAPAAQVNVTTATFALRSDESGGTFECSLDAGPFVACADPAAFTVDAGDHVLAVRAIDTFGNVDPTPVTHAWTVDLVAPETQLPVVPPAITRLTTATFQLSSNDADAHFECRLDGASEFVVCANPVELTGLADRLHTFEVRAVDVAGNRDATPAEYQWEVDSTPPGPPLILSPSAGALLAVRTVTVTGSAELNSRVTLTVDGATAGTADVDPEGRWSLQVAGPLADGAHALEATATDLAENAGAPATSGFTVDATLPETTIVSGPAAFVSSTEATFALSSSEDEVSYECSPDGAPFADCKTPFALSELAEGEHTLAVRATDRAGNVDPTPASFGWTVDTIAPETEVVSGPSDPMRTSAATFELGSNEQEVRYECQLDDAKDGFTACATPATFAAMTAGDHRLQVRAIDRAGNVDSSPAVFSWVVNADTDGDGLFDLDELARGTDPSESDSDHDGLSDGVEVTAALTSPLDGDSDDDGLLDGSEDVDHDGQLDDGETDPSKFDTDGDLLSDGLERGLTVAEGSGEDTDAERFVADADPTTVTDPLRADSDGASVWDGYEDSNRNGRVDAGETDPNQASDDVDADADGIDNETERAVGMNPFDDDSDDDGVADGVDGTADTDRDGKLDALDSDSDDDGVLDGTEAGVTADTAPTGTDRTSSAFRADLDPTTRTDPKQADSDGDGLSDGAEDVNGDGRVDAKESDPKITDTDANGVPDGTEVANGQDPTDPIDDWDVAGGCSASGDSALAPFALVLVLLVSLRRRKAGAVLAAALLCSAAAQAQTASSTAIDVQRFKPAPGERDLLGLHSAKVASHGSWRVGLVSNFADSPLSVVGRTDGETWHSIVDSQLTFDAIGSFTLFDRYELGVALPVTLQATQSEPLDGQQLSGGGLGDLRLVPKARIGQVADGLELAVVLPVVLPTGGASSFLGGSGIGVQPRLVGEWSPGAVRVIANLGLDLRRVQRLHNLETGTELAYGLGGELPFKLGARDFAAGATLFGSYGLNGEGAVTRPLELLGSVRWNVLPGLRVNAGGGKGLTRGYGAPAYRLLLGIDWSFGEYAAGRQAVAATPVP